MSISKLEEQASQAQSKADEDMEDYRLIVAAFLMSLYRAREQRDENMIRDAINAFLLAINALLERGSNNLIAAIITAFPLYRQAFPIVNPAPVMAGVNLIMDGMRQDLMLSLERLRLQSAQTGLLVTDLAQTGLVTARKFNEIKQAVDVQIQTAAQEALWSGGSGVYNSKIAVPVIDNGTTDLCRNRMAYQVRAWDEPFTDPKTGAQWQFPPFIGGGLPPAEAFHWCRTTVAPYNRE